MSDLLRDTALGQVIRFVTKNKLLQYPEERAGFQLPEQYVDAGKTTPTEKEDAIETPGSEPERFEPLRPARTTNDLERELSRVPTRVTLEKMKTRDELEQAYTRATLKPAESQAIAPEVLDSGTILVDFYTTDDPENPQNWSLKKKIWVTTVIDLYTFAVYLGSAIYTPSIPGVIEAFGVSPQAASLGLSMYVLGYGVGPLLWSPISEIPLLGRNPPYIATFAIFVILCVPTALVNNFAGFVVLRFLQGFFGSPCLATAGASFGDIYSLIKLPYAVILWAAFATCGPALGPLISGFSVPAETWRWSLWEILWLSGPTFILLFVALPETSTPNLLLRRANRLRKLTGNTHLKSQSEIDQANMVPREVLIEALVRPFQLMLFDPSIAFTAIYTSLIYAIYYSFFEAFPIVFLGFYQFNYGEMGLTFLSITVALCIAIPVYAAYMYYVVEPDLKKNGLGAPERRLIPALPAAFLLPVGLFLFAWTARTEIHWIVPIIGIVIFTIGIFIVIQVIFVYLPLSYPQYAASLFAGNDFARSALAAGTIHFSSPMFHNLKIGPAVSLLAALTTGCIAGIFALFFLGAKLRSRSRFTAK